MDSHRLTDGEVLVAKVNRQKCEAFLSVLNLQLGWWQVLKRLICSCPTRLEFHQLFEAGQEREVFRSVFELTQALERKFFRLIVTSTIDSRPRSNCVVVEGSGTGLARMTA